MSCSTFSSLASNTRSSAYFSVNDLPAYFEVSQPFQSFLGKVFAVQVELLSFMNFIINNQEIFQTNSYIHNTNTRNKLIFIDQMPIYLFFFFKSFKKVHFMLA